ncbi:MAG: phosphoribosylformylglycinamidine synthase subunit PurS [Candidatus Dormibacteraeota bacterium]|nr:phosphoribosylformylglycinamidine synthase subunit PurS [Candidatus Dormibacteraeota bacterium]MBV9525107.1 phosphoribosylformylglycinamidine synthase subunit PurS [Candidatus Dormibacteraeota bacterium]
MIFIADVVVHLKPVVNDPQGLVVRDGLRRLGFADVHGVRVGKHIQVELDAGDEQGARAAVESMCDRLLRNPVIEDYRIDAVRAVAEAAAAS